MLSVLIHNVCEIARNQTVLFLLRLCLRVLVSAYVSRVQFSSVACFCSLTYLPPLIGFISNDLLYEDSVVNHVFQLAYRAIC